MLRARKGLHIGTLRPKYILHSYTVPWGDKPDEELPDLLKGCGDVGQAHSSKDACGVYM